MVSSYLETVRKGLTEKHVLYEEKEIGTWFLTHFCALIKPCLKLISSRLLSLVSQYIPFLKYQVELGFCYLKWKTS